MENAVNNVAVIAMGEMGSGVASRLIEQGVRVLTSLEGRSAASADRAKAIGAEIVDDATVVSEAEILLSIVPPVAAAATADRFRSLIEQSNRPPMFIDCNAIAPQTLAMLARPFLDCGLPFADGSIIGNPPRSGYSPRIYLSGPAGEQAAFLKAHGLDSQVLSDKIGDASTLKMAFAGITKGFQALGTAMALGAARTGAADQFKDEMQRTSPVLYAWLSKMLPAMPAKAYRWDDEMREVAKFLEPERGAADMLLGAAALYQHVAEDNKRGSTSEIISTLNNFLQK